MREMFVNVYTVQQGYGGPEEGGWWYEIGTPVTCMKTTCNCNSQWHWPSNDICPVTHCFKYTLDNYILGHKEEYLDSFITAGGTWSPDSMDDAPSENIGEIATTGKRSIRVETFPAMTYPQNKPYYE
jgi:hypothetical protein